MVIRTIKLTSLFVNTENYRFEPLSSQKEAIDKMIEDQGDKLYSLVDDIVTNGLSPVDLIIGEFYQFNLSSCIRQQNSLTAQFVSFSLSNLANIFYPPNFYNN